MSLLSKGEKNFQWCLYLSCQQFQRGRLLFIVIVIVVNSYQSGWFDFHVDCISLHIISKVLEKDRLKKMFWKRLIETFIFSTVEASRHFLGIIFFEIFLMIFNGFIFVNWWNYFILWNEKRKMKMDKIFGALTLVESGSLNFLKKLASGTFLWAPYM